MAPRLTFTDEFERALAILNSGDNLFLTGKAGTGKSTLIRHYVANSNRRLVVAAPTGIAALNVDGYTLHRLFSFSTTTTVEDIAHGHWRPGRFAEVLATLETLVIDEASMVRADLFDMIAAALTKHGPKMGQPFGGVQIVLVGDLLQLPPVVPTMLVEHFTQRYQTPYFFSADSFRAEEFPTVALTRVFRQEGDQQLTSLLNAVREGTLLERARTMLNTRVDPDFEIPQDDFWLTLATTNRIVHARNRQQLERLPGPEYESKAREFGELRGFDPPTERILRFKVGAQIMMLNNDPSERWVNGTLGRIEAIHEDPESPEDDSLQIVFRDGSRAVVGRHTWEITRPTAVGGRLDHELIGSFRQFPFALAWAITIHKSQGQTLERLVVDLSGGTFDHGQTYVALSRVTSLAGLVLTRPVLPKDLKTDRRVQRFLHESTMRHEGASHCAVAALFVGDEGTRSRPRPVEIAIAFEDGTALSTLVNPERDLADARFRFGVGADDVLLAPRLDEVWSLWAPLLEGRIPVGIDVDDTLAKIDFELKRRGLVTAVPLGAELPMLNMGEQDYSELAAPRALTRARAMMRLWQRHGAERPGTPFDFEEPLEDDAAYQLSRDTDLDLPVAAALPTVSAMVAFSHRLSRSLLSLPGPDEHAGHVEDEALMAVMREALAERLTAVVARLSRLTPLVQERLELVEKDFGICMMDAVADMFGVADTAEQVLAAGVRVCFTGTVIGPDGYEMDREDMHDLARLHGLQPVDNVTKTRCDVLVVAELSSQSGKSRKARAYGKPVLSADEFFTWTSGGQ